jgi:HSP20 family protein
MAKEIQAVEKVAAEAGGEQTRAVPVFAPRVDIYETDEGLTVLAEMPGVDRDGLMIDLKDYTMTLRGAVQPALAEGRSVVYREYEVGDYFRQFTLSEVIDPGQDFGLAQGRGPDPGPAQGGAGQAPQDRGQDRVAGLRRKEGSAWQATQAI